MRRYIALIHPDADHGLSVTLPDFPGLVAGAEAFDKVRELITGALVAQIEAMERRGERLPIPSSFEALMADPRHAESAAMLVWAKGEKLASSRDDRPAEPFKGGNSNDEWPEADA
jgi:predicted RNase H-like HicB family nuclease